MYYKITEEYINQRIGEQMLSAEQWSSLTRDVVSVLHSWRMYKSQDRPWSTNHRMDRAMDATRVDVTLWSSSAASSIF